MRLSRSCRPASRSGWSDGCGVGLFVLPPAFIANPALLRPDLDLPLAVAAAVKIGVGIGCLSYAVIGPGPGRWLQRLLALGLGLVTIFTFRL